MKRTAGVMALSGIGLVLAGAVMSPADAASLHPSVVVPSTWSVVPSADPGSTQGGNGYSGISCVGPNFCLAVGTSDLFESSQTGIAAQWNGTSWRAVRGADPDANPGNYRGVYLNSVSCVSAAFCMVVGSYQGTNNVFTEVWNGSSWTVESAPSIDEADFANYLNGVSCTSTTSCDAAGDAYAAGPQIPLLESWNGTTWTLDSAPTYASDVHLAGISCVSATSCQAVGSVGSDPLAIGLSGNTWATETTPPDSGGAEFSSVSCFSTLFCEAVGSQTPQVAKGSYQNLAEEWNGTTWTLQTTPDSNPFLDQGLSGVSCFGPTSCVAGGWEDPGKGDQSNNATLAWNGAGWALQSVPNALGSNNNEIQAIDCVPNDLCLTVGNQAIASGPTSTEALTAPIYRPGYAEVASDGGLFNFGTPFYGSMGGQPLNKPIVGMAMTPDGGGYWQVASDGGIFAFGDAAFYGSMGGQPLNKPIVGLAPILDGQGYYEVASDGGIFAFGDAKFYGSMGGQPLHKPIVGIATTPDGQGYYEVAADGGIFAFGDAVFNGSMGGKPLNQPIVGIAASSAGGYYEVASDGGLFAFGPGTPFHGSMGGQPLNKPIVGMTIDPAGGYYEVASDGGIFAFGGAPFLGSMGGNPLNQPIVDIAS